MLLEARCCRTRPERWCERLVLVAALLPSRTLLQMPFEELHLRSRRTHSRLHPARLNT